MSDYDQVDEGVHEAIVRRLEAEIERLQSERDLWKDKADEWGIEIGRLRAQTKNDKTPASRQLLNITKAALDSAEQECLNIRNHTIEECARLVDNFKGDKYQMAAAIRALKEKP